MASEEGDVVRVQGKQGTFRVRDVIREEDGILGYRVFDKEMRLRCYTADRVRPKKAKKKKRRGRS